jgi:aminomethyltransferase
MDDRRPFLYDLHVELGAKIVPFGGWAMPLQYGTGTVAEHLACRNDAVVFDVSHLGTVRCDGPEMLEALQRTLTNDLGKIAPGRAQYTHLLTDEGFVVDDIIVWWVGEHEFDVMPNASRARKGQRSRRTLRRGRTFPSRALRLRGGGGPRRGHGLHR